MEHKEILTFSSRCSFLLLFASKRSRRARKVEESNVYAFSFGNTLMPSYHLRISVLRMKDDVKT